MSDYNDIIVNTKLNAQQQLYCRKYVETLDRATAYIYAYWRNKENPSRVDASKQASRLMKKEEINTYIQALKEETAADKHITSGFLIDKALYVFTESAKQKNIVAFNPETKRLEPTGETQMADPKAANQSLELISKLTGLNVAKLDVNTKIEKTSIEFIGDQLFGSDNK